jgi:hypothetical protein
MESIQTKAGFYGRQCDSYLLYILSQCEHHKASTLAGEHCSTSTAGMYFISTNAKSPFAKGRAADEARNVSEMERAVSNSQQRAVCNNLTDESLKQLLNCMRFEPRVIRAGENEKHT